MFNESVQSNSSNCITDTNLYKLQSSENILLIFHELSQSRNLCTMDDFTCQKKKRKRKATKMIKL